MTGASKILTVSYGTFSCTLEGFDDPFNTMKAIAEYFRDLAAEDRYFGAEPPTPDAAMLHRIAEREIHRRVEAKIQDNGVILRAGDAAAPEGLPAPAAIPAVVPAVADADPESVAARLQRIRARHAAAQTAEAAPVVEVAAPALAADESYIEDQHAEDLAPAAGGAEGFPEIEIPDQLEEILDEAEADLAPAAIEADTGLDALLQDDLAEAETEIESAVEFGAEFGAEEDFADLPMAEDFDQVDNAAEDAEAAMLASLSVDFADDTQDEMLEEVTESAAPVAEADGFDEDGMLARLSFDEPAAEDVALDDLMAEAAVEADPMLIETVDQMPEDPAEDPAAAEEVDEVKPQRARARVIRIRRVDPVQPEAVAEPAPVAAPTSAPSALSDAEEAALQAELAALEAELGGFTHEVAPEVTAEPEIDAQPAPAVEPVAKPVAITLTEEDPVNRLMEHANSEMGGEETRRRQSAIAHLKAAVAATVADRTPVGRDETRRQEAYRNDLDRVVRPRRPVAESSTPRPAAPEAETAPRPTPLVLVSAQRIDRSPADTLPEAATAPRVVMPVRPRRVTSAAPAVAAAMDSDPEAAARFVMQDADQDEFDDDIDFDAEAEADSGNNVFADATSFQDFADQLGASALPDLLEAAAVYCAEVLQRPEFSRPLVMRQLAGLPGQTAAAREDYLRGFGTLLRQGRIAKVKRGMFALTDRSPYLAEARKQAS
jgi:hypothetical protein